jgi:peptide/nickel transport system permease protein
MKRITALLIIFLGAPFIAPYSEGHQNRSRALEGPTHIGWLTVKDNGGQYPIRFFSDGHLFSVAPPARIFLIGTDEYGRDLFSRFLYGGRLSLSTGIIATLLTVSLGLIIGSISGFYGGWVDELLMRVTELFLSLPWLYLLLAARALLPLQLSPSATFLTLMTVLAVAGWPRPARLVRGVLLSAKERAYVSVAKSLGASPLYLITRHIFPEVRGLLVTQALLLLPQFVVADITLSFLGLGAGEPNATWGGLLASLRHLYAFESHWGRILPAILIVAVLILIQTSSFRKSPFRYPEM